MFFFKMKKESLKKIRGEVPTSWIYDSSYSCVTDNFISRLLDLNWFYTQNKQSVFFPSIKTDTNLVLTEEVFFFSAREGQIEKQKGYFLTMKLWSN